MRRWRASPMLMPRLGSRATKRPDVGGRIIIECQYITSIHARYRHALGLTAERDSARWVVCDTQIDARR